MVSNSEIIDAFAFFVRLRLQNGPSADEMAATVAAWEIALDDVFGPEFQKASQDWAKSSRWWPTPADLRALVPRLAAGGLALEEADAETGRDYWPEVVRQAGSIGRSHPRWAEQLAARIGITDIERLSQAIEASGGWQALCNADHDAQRARMGKRFAAAWDRQGRAAQVHRQIEGRGGNILNLAAEAAKRIGAK